MEHAHHYFKHHISTPLHGIVPPHIAGQNLPENFQLKDSTTPLVSSGNRSMVHNLSEQHYALRTIVVPYGRYFE